MNQEPLKAMVTEGALKKWIKKSSWWWYYSWGMQRDWFSIGQVLWILFFFFSCTSVRFAFFFAYNQFVGPKISPGIDGDRVSSRFVTTWSACWRSADDLRIRVATARARQSASPGASSRMDDMTCEQLLTRARVTLTEESEETTAAGQKGRVPKWIRVDSHNEPP